MLTSRLEALSSLHCGGEAACDLASCLWVLLLLVMRGSSARGAWCSALRDKA